MNGAGQQIISTVPDQMADALKETKVSQPKMCAPRPVHGPCALLLSISVPSTSKITANFRHQAFLSR
jgi:hypothetical protein